MVIHIEVNKENLMKAPKLILSKVMSTAKMLLNKRIKIVNAS